MKNRVQNREFETPVGWASPGFSRRRWLILLLLLGARAARAEVDLMPSLLAHAERMDVTREGKRFQSAVLVAPAAVLLPVKPEGRPAVLHMTVAPIFNIGDGFDLSVQVRGSASARQVYTCYFDPGRRAQDRKWKTLSIPIQFEAADDALEIRLSAGPHGDLIDDWLALARVELLAGPSR